MFRALRVHQQLPTRRPKNRPKTLSVIKDAIEGKNLDEMIFHEVPTSDAPGVVVLPIFQPPRILQGLPPSDQLGDVTFGVWATTKDAEQRQQKLQASGLNKAMVHSRLPFGPFLRLLTKIAHGYDVANVGIEKTDDTLNSYILRKDDKIPYLVGGTPPNGPIPIVLPIPHDDSGLHQVYPFAIIIDDTSYIAAQIRLFARLRPPTPVYTVVMRRHRLADGDPYFTVLTKK
jgi:hypothetical protein